ncbi:hypothetical protein, unlikely [Trypanosoma congolense IL3000]|uniref:Uncharacterized protein n=1 Tax=Trypanosoma congolense (strain IL3000) TaxID=1068625 RepID=F9WBW4_TRYCI|nr:hypothetical protein, unlikely [Trypanosoma congolense IL3000]
MYEIITACASSFTRKLIFIFYFINLFFQPLFSAPFVVTCIPICAPRHLSPHHFNLCPPFMQKLGRRDITFASTFFSFHLLFFTQGHLLTRLPSTTTVLVAFKKVAQLCETFHSSVFPTFAQFLLRCSRTMCHRFPHPSPHTRYN